MILTLARHPKLPLCTSLCDSLVQHARPMKFELQRTKEVARDFERECCGIVACVRLNVCVFFSPQSRAFGLPEEVSRVAAMSLPNSLSSNRQRMSCKVSIANEFALTCDKTEAERCVPRSLLNGFELRRHLMFSAWSRCGPRLRILSLIDLIREPSFRNGTAHPSPFGVAFFLRW